MGVETAGLFPQPSPAREEGAILGTFCTVKTYAHSGHSGFVQCVDKHSALINDRSTFRSDCEPFNLVEQGKCFFEVPEK